MLPRVLLADDHEAMLARARALLSDEYDVVSVADGLAAVAAAVRLPPDVVVLDISMPGLSGIDVARRIRAAGCEARIVFLTVHDDPDFIREGLSTGAMAYVVKTRVASDLMFAVQEALEGHAFVSPSNAASH